MIKDTPPLTGTVKETVQHVLIQFYHKLVKTTGVKINHFSLVPNHSSAYAILLFTSVLTIIYLFI